MSQHPVRRMARRDRAVRSVTLLVVAALAALVLASASGATHLGGFGHTNNAGGNLSRLECSRATAYCLEIENTALNGSGLLVSVPNSNDSAISGASPHWKGRRRTFHGRGGRPRAIAIGCRSPRRRHRHHRDRRPRSAPRAWYCARCHGRDDFRQCVGRRRPRSGGPDSARCQLGRRARHQQRHRRTRDRRMGLTGGLGLGCVRRDAQRPRRLRVAYRADRNGGGGQGHDELRVGAGGRCARRGERARAPR